MKNRGEIIIYQVPDGTTSLAVKLENETVWLTQAQMVELFETTPQNVTLHIGNVYKERELEQMSTCKDSYKFDKKAKGRCKDISPIIIWM